MMVYNHRLVEGTPLQYYVPPLVPPPFPYFKRFEVHTTPEMNEEMLPPSPHSTQSDSDNSISSVEPTTEAPVKCCWKSCGIYFESLDQLATHVTRVHASSGPGGLFYCGWEGCTRNNRGFNARYKMLVHVRTHTNEKPHKCDKCEKSFSRAENLKIHSRSHSGEKPYVCPVPGCNKAYSNSSDRFKHTRTHQVEKPYKCKIPGCPKRYTDPSSLRKHVKTYKHFVVEKEPEAPTVNNVEVVVENRVQEVQNCTRACCAPNDLSMGGTKMLRLEAFLNLKSERWNEFLDPFAGQKSAFRPYEEMEVDMPLDLSVGRRRFS